MKKHSYSNWWQEAFIKGNYPLVELTSDQHWKVQTRRQIKFLIDNLNLPKGAKILDLACGAGRHSIPLARYGYQMTGLDLSPVYLAQAKKLSAQINLPITWIRQDMRRMNFKDSFDAVINLFNSFGYFPNAHDDLVVLKRIYRSLKTKGLFLIDTFDQTELMRDFHPQSWAEISKGSFVLGERRILKGKKALLAHWIFLLKNKPRRDIHSFNRCYTPKSLARLIHQSGLKVLKIWPALKHPMENPGRRPIRFIILAQKP